MGSYTTHQKRKEMAYYTQAGWDALRALCKDDAFDTTTEGSYTAIKTSRGKFLLNIKTGTFSILNTEEYEELKCSLVPWNKLTHINFPR